MPKTQTQIASALNLINAVPLGELCNYTPAALQVVQVTLLASLVEALNRIDTKLGTLNKALEKQTETQWNAAHNICVAVENQ